MRQSFKNNKLFFPAGKIKSKDINNVLNDIKYYVSKSKKLGPLERHKPHLIIPSVFDLSKNEIIRSSVNNFLGKKSFLWYSVFFFKSKSSEEYIPWHYDEYFFSLSAEKGCTVWVAIDDVTDNMGPMEFCLDPISEYPHQTETNEKNILSRGNTSNFKPNTKSIIKKVCLQKGEFSIHSNNIWHRSGSNTSNKDRIAVALRYITIDAVPHKLKFIKRGIVGENYNKGFFYEEKRPDRICKPLKGSHLYSILNSLLVSAFGDKNRNLSNQLKDLINFIFSSKGYKIIIGGITSIFSKKEQSNKFKNYE